MPTTETTSKYRRATEFTKGLGDNLDKIAGTDVILHSYTIEDNRKFGDGTNTLVSMQISTMSDEENKQLFHAWSEPLATRFRELDGEVNDGRASLPLIVKFVKAKTTGGFSVWTIE